MTKQICIAGATGWAGSALAQRVFAADDLALTAAVSRTHSGKTLGEVLNINGLQTPVFASAEEAVKSKPDIFFEYTKPDVAKSNIITALKAGCHVVVGTSGLCNCQ